jgi:acetoin utilization deacetylase AcuC-like enzyme
MKWEALTLGPDHPFKPERATKTFDLCTRYGVLNYPWMKVVAPETIDEGLLTLYHEPDYLALLKEASRAGCLSRCWNGVWARRTPPSFRASTNGL